MDLPALKRWLLPLSLAANVSLATVVVMNEMGYERRPFPPGPPPGPPNFLHMAEHEAGRLPAADGKLLIGSFKKRRADFEKGRAAMDAAQAKLKEALKDGAYDPQALKEGFEGIRQARDALDAAIFSAIAEAADGMSEAGRRKLGERGFGPPGPPPGR